MIWVLLFMGGFVALVAWSARKLGPRQVDAGVIGRGRVVVQVTRDDPGVGWSDLGSLTEARGLDLRFGADDDPAAEASLVVPGAPAGKGTMANGVTVTLSDEFREHHVHSGGWVFRVSLRGTGSVVGAKTDLKMLVTTSREGVCGRIENDDDERPPAMGDWIEIDWAEIRDVRRVPKG